MKNDDFRYMWRGKQLSGLNQEQIQLLKPVTKYKKGNESALLLLHGFSSSPAVYRNLIPKIKHYNAIICPVLQGHAESIDTFSLAKAQEWHSTANVACNELFEQYDKVDVLGLSLGGLLACELSQHYNLNHLFLLAPALKLKMNTYAMIKLAQTLKYLGFKQLRNAAGNLMTQAEAEIAYRKLPISTIIEMLCLAQDYKWLAPNCPTDLFLGTHDDVVDSVEVEKLFISLPNTTIHWLKNSAHVLPLDNDYKEIIRCINQHNSSPCK